MSTYEGLCHFGFARSISLPIVPYIVVYNFYKKYQRNGTDLGSAKTTELIWQKTKSVVLQMIARRNTNSVNISQTTEDRKSERSRLLFTQPQPLTGRTWIKWKSTPPFSHIFNASVRSWPRKFHFKSDRFVCYVLVFSTPRSEKKNISPSPSSSFIPCSDPICQSLSMAIQMQNSVHLKFHGGIMAKDRNHK